MRNHTDALLPASCLSVPELGQRLGISKQKAWQLVWAREIDFVRIGRRVVITGAAFEKYLEKHTIKAAR